MKFSINQSELQGAISIVSKGLSTRSTLPILSGIYLEARGDSLLMQTTDLELSVQYVVSALVEEEGRAVVPGKLFESIVKSLPDAAVCVEERGGFAAVTCDSAAFSIKTLDAGDFPGFPQVETGEEIVVPFPQFASMVKRVARVVSKDESRAVLTGVLITAQEGLLRMVATDSYRLAITDASVESGSCDGFSAVISGSFLQGIAALPRTEDDIHLALAENQIVVTYGDVVLVNRRIEGKYPNYRQLLPSTCATRACIQKEKLASAVKRMSVLGQNSIPVRFEIDTESGTILLTATTQDVGTVQEVVPCTGEGEAVSIAFNCSYVLEGLSAVDTENVYLEVQSSLKPGIFRADEDEGYLYLVMPVRLS